MSSEQQATARERIASVAQGVRGNLRNRIKENEQHQREAVEEYGDRVTSTSSYQAGQVVIALLKLALAFIGGKADAAFPDTAE